MANLYYFQGFDIHGYTNYPGFNAGGYDDLASEWFGGTNVWLSYRNGYDEGRSIYVDRYPGVGLRFYSGLRPGGHRICASAWFRESDSGRGGFVNLWQLHYIAGGTANWTRIYVRTRVSDNNRNLEIWEGSNLLGYAGQFWNPLGWMHIQIFVDLDAGEIKVLNKGIEYTFPCSTRPDFGVWDIRTGGSRTPGSSGSLNTGPYYDFDHCVISETPFTGEGIRGVSVVSSLDRYEGVSQFRGGLVIGGQRYLSSYRDNSSVSSKRVSDWNLMNTSSFIFPKHPTTGQEWTTASFQTIESWGLCYESFIPGGQRDVARVIAMALSYVDANNGAPLVRTFAPVKSAFFSGAWSKTDPLKSFTAHVNTIPRPSGVDKVADSTHLFIDGPGCLYFLPPSTSGDQPTSIVGLSFAEERRTDFNEWYDIIGDALPFKSYFITGYNVLAEGNKSFQSNYVTVNYVPLPFGSAYIQGLWDYAQSGDTGRWSSTQQIYSNSDTRYSNRMRKLKIRGNGNALQMKVTSEDNKPFSINGWTIAASSNGAV